MHHLKHVHCYLMTGAILVFGYSFLMMIATLVSLVSFVSICIFGVFYTIRERIPVIFFGHVILIGSQNLSRIRRRGGVDLASGPAERLALFLFSLLLLLALVGDVTAVPQHAQRQDHHEDDAQHGAPSEHPADGFDLGLGVAVENDADFVGDLLDLWRIDRC